MTLLSFLQAIPLFHTLKRQQLERLADKCQSGCYPSETVIIRQGDMGNTFYVIEAGVVCVYKQPEQDSPVLRAYGQQSKPSRSGTQRSGHVASQRARARSDASDEADDAKISAALCCAMLRFGIG